MKPMAACKVLTLSIATGVSRRQVLELFKIVEFHDYIWILHEKCNQMSTNMPGIGFVIPEKDFEILEVFLEKSKVLFTPINSRIKPPVLYS